MKTKSGITVIIIILMTFFIHKSYASNEWVQYTHGDDILAIADDGNYMWIGTTGGLVKLNKSTGEKTFINNYNSGLPCNGVRSIAIDHERQQMVWDYRRCSHIWRRKLVSI